MIQYSLCCDNDHKFDAWFKSSTAYDAQLASGDITCPICASAKVEKALMAPALKARSNRKVALTSGHPAKADIQRKLRELRDEMLNNSDYVGDKFAEEARKIHEDDAEARSIHGEATADEVGSLIEDGIDFMPVPTLPDEHN